MITIVAKSVLVPGTKEEFMRLTKELVDKSRREPGNISYNLYEDIDDENTVCFIEEWRDEAAIEFHNNTDHFRESIPARSTITVSKEVIKYKQIG